MIIRRFKNSTHPPTFCFVILCIACLLITGTTYSHAKETETIISYNIPHTESGPVIDGEITEGEWELAERVFLDLETYPAENTPASVETEALMMEDGNNFYLAFIASDPEPDKIRAFYRDRDASYEDDFVAIVIDTFNDERRAYELLVNPLGVQMDLIYDAIANNEDDSWNAIWDSAGKITDTGYIVEMKIPLNQLRFPEGLDKQVWGIDLIRRYPRDKRTRLSNNKRDDNLSCYLCQVKKAQGFAQLKQDVNLQLVPAVTASYSENRPSPEKDAWQEDFDPQAGIDIRWGINQDFYLNATINPDFSQVEADVAQLNINNTFSLFYPERRDFFLDGADYFNTHDNLVYTRNISSPDYGIKLTGKRDIHTYGLFFANDETTNFIIPDNQGSRIGSLANIKSYNTAYRYRLDINQKTNLGMIFTDRRGDDYSNTVLGIDGNIRIGDKDTVDMLLMKSYSEYPYQIQNDFNQKPKIQDYAYFLRYEHDDERWHWGSHYKDYGNDFRADMGFINRVDFKKMNIHGSRKWRFGPESRFNRFDINGGWNKYYDESGNKLEEEFEIGISAEGPMQAYLDLGYSEREHFYNGKYFDEFNIAFFSQIRPKGGMEIQLEAEYGDCIDFANTRLGRMTSLGPRLRLQTGKHFQIDWRYNYQKMDIDGNRLYATNLSDLRLTYQFGLRSFIRATVQYSDTKRDQSLYTFDIDGRSKDLTTQLLYSYKINPQTRFFIGYSDTGFQDDDLDDITRTNYTIFTKLSYAWQYS
ncbi:DUF5916 domain-containing protein [Thermodesulfobacteriota bacterium]